MHYNDFADILINRFPITETLPHAQNIADNLCLKPKTDKDKVIGIALHAVIKRVETANSMDAYIAAERWLYILTYDSDYAWKFIDLHTRKAHKRTWDYTYGNKQKLNSRTMFK